MFKGDIQETRYFLLCSRLLSFTKSQLAKKVVLNCNSSAHGFIVVAKYSMVNIHGGEMTVTR